MIQYNKESIDRAIKAANINTHVICIRTSLITSAQKLMELWTAIQNQYPDICFEIVPFENTK